MTFDVYPSAENSRYFKSIVDRQLFSSFDYLFDVVEKALGDSLDTQRENLSNTASSIEIGVRVSSRAFIAHTKLKQAIDLQDREAVGQVIDYLANADLISPSLSVDSIQRRDRSEFEFSMLVEVFKSGYTSSYGDEPDMLPVTPKLVENNCAMVRKALKNLADAQKDTYDELHEVVTDILLYESTFMNSGSSMNTLGLVTMSALRPHQNWTTFVEAIAHEAGHHALYYMMLVEPVLQPGDDYYYSPLRKAKRPMIGIFHAMFVVARMVLVMQALRNLYESLDQPLDVVSPHNNAGNDAPPEEKFEVLFETVDKNAKLTDAGRRITNSCRTLVDRALTQTA